MFAACRKGDVSTLKQILKTPDVDINKVNRNNNDGFIIGCQFGNVEIVKLLLENNCKMWQTSSFNGLNGFLFACKNGHFDIIKLLMENYTVNNYASLKAKGTTIHKIKSNIKCSMGKFLRNVICGLP